MKNHHHNRDLMEAYKKLQEIFGQLDARPESIVSMRMKFYSAMSNLRHWAHSEEEKAFARECEMQIQPYYQIALERQYEAFQAQKVPDYTAIDFWTLTLAPDGTPTKTTVVDVEKGRPVYADGCTGAEILDETRTVGSCRYKLNRWLESNRNLYELRVAALALKKKGSLGMSEPPTPNYDMGGLVGGQLDAAAWQNYAIENGLVRRTDHDEALDRLLEAIDKCIDFYEKAVSIV